MFDYLKPNDRSRKSASATPSPRSSSESTRPNTPKNEKYMLRVTAGPSYDVSTHKSVHVNGTDPVAIENEFMSVRLKVRIRGYNGLPRGSAQTSPYFSHPIHKSDQYSIAFTFVPRVTIPSVDASWGNDFDHPIRDRLPPGFNTAFRIVKQFIDPGLECDAYADEPWLYGPALSCWFALRIGEKAVDEASENFSDAVSAAASEHGGKKDEAADVILEGADGSGVDVRNAKGLPEASEKRRKYFLDEAHRRGFEFEKGRVYQADFYNPYLDFSNFSLKLPGFSLGVLRYIGDKTHTLRYVFKNRVTGDVFFVVEMKLLFGEDLTDALQSEEDARSLHNNLQPSTSIDDLD